MAPNICVSSVFNILDVTFMTPRILGGSYLFWRDICAPLYYGDHNFVGDKCLVELTINFSGYLPVFLRHVGYAYKQEIMELNCWVCVHIS